MKKTKSNKPENIFWTKVKRFFHPFFYHRYMVSDGTNGTTLRYVEKKRSNALLYVLLIAAIFVACWFFIPIKSNIYLDQLWTIIKQLFVPSKWSLKTYDQWWAYLWGTACPKIWQTVEMVFIATVLGVILSIPVTLLACQNIVLNKWVRNIVKVITNIVRTIPTFVLAIIATIFFGFNETAGVAAMAIFTLGVMFKLMYEYIETVDMNPFEAISSCGGNRLDGFDIAIYPEIKPMFISNIIYVFEINIRASVVLGFVGAGGIGQLLSDAIESTQYDKVGAILIPLFVVVLCLQLISSYIRRKIT